MKVIYILLDIGVKRYPSLLKKLWKGEKNMEKKKQLVKLIAMLLASSGLFALAGCGGDFLDEFACGGREDVPVKGVSVPGFCFNSHKMMVGCLEGTEEVESDELEEYESTEGEQSTGFISCDSGEGEESSYTILSCTDVENWGCTCKGCGTEEKAAGCVDGCIKVEDTDGQGGAFVKIWEFIIGID